MVLPFRSMVILQRAMARKPKVAPTVLEGHRPAWCAVLSFRPSYRVVWICLLGDCLSCYRVGSLSVGTTVSVLFPIGVYNDFWCTVVPWYLFIFSELINKLATISNSGALDLRGSSGCEGRISYWRMKQQRWLLGSLGSQQGCRTPQGKGCSGKGVEPAPLPLLGEFCISPHPCSSSSLRLGVR